METNQIEEDALDRTTCGGNAADLNKRGKNTVVMLGTSDQTGVDSTLFTLAPQKYEVTSKYQSGDDHQPSPNRGEIDDGENEEIYDANNESKDSSNPVTAETSKESNTSTGTRLSLRDLAMHPPAESEAETYILRTVEAIDQTIPGVAENQPNTLDEMLGDREHVSFADTKPTAVSPSARSSSMGSPSFGEQRKLLSNVCKPQHIDRRSKSTAENLWDLTENLTRLQGVNDESDVKLNGRIIDKGGSSADVLANNGTRLLLRQRRAYMNLSSTTVEEGPAQNLDTPTQKSTAADRWKKIKLSLHAEEMQKHTKGELKPIDEEIGDDDNDGDNSNVIENGNMDSKRMKLQQAPKQTFATEMKETFDDFENWLIFKKSSIMTYIKLMLFVIFPALGISCILFYFADNPPCGTNSECLEKRVRGANEKDGDIQELIESDTSYSWWIQFIFVRHLLIFSLSAMTKALVIDFLCIRTRILLTLAGPVVTLFTVQSKGWPFLLTGWGLYSFMFLYGNHPFAQHWLYWQDFFEVFNASNPSGNVPSLPAYRKLLVLSVCIGFAVSVKRFWVALLIGKHTFSRYATDLANLMAKVLLVAQVAELARDVENYGYRLQDYHLDHELFTKSISQEEDQVVCSEETVSHRSTSELIVGEERVFESKQDLKDNSNTNKINKLLGEWEEPKEMHKSDEIVKISSIIQFRTSLSCLNTQVPFGPAFGLARNRHECIESAENVFRQLLQATPGKYVLTFDTLALLAVDNDGELDEVLIRELIRVFRPDRNGDLTLIDFAKSVDAVYKELRLLRASVLNSSRMDRAFETIINVVFYFILYCVVLSVLGIDPLVLFASGAGFVLAFAFMIGPAASKYFEGILFILVRRPYDIGDRIHVSNPNSDTSSTGSMTWFVRDVTLFTTTVCLAVSNEVATYSNGSLASSRIINAARSPNASIKFPIKFPIDTSYDQLQAFKHELEDFVKARPREYLSFTLFACKQVVVDLGYVEYDVVVKHRESWQALGAIVSSKAELVSFALELSKTMNLRYSSPPMPIDLRYKVTSIGSVSVGNNQDSLDKKQFLSKEYELAEFDE